ncbi:MAG: hypothetical protein J1E83_12535 [Lachnospiraceae bacterium]|nr:hypothetical protein [Lachnospiraceae bacterium]
MNRVIFLDIDGVLNSNFWNDSHQREISDGTLIDVEKVKLLSRLVKSTNAKIVLHSGWKHWFDQDLKPLRLEAEKLRMMFEREGLLLEDITPDHSTEEIRRSKKFSLVKAGEILAWLAEHGDVDSWIVMDDLDLHNTEIEMHQVKTDPSVGLTVDDVHKAEKMLLVDKY